MYKDFSWGMEALPSGPILLQLHENVAAAVIVFKLSVDERSKISNAVCFSFFDL